MSRAMPSLLALLSLVAMAGYQNRAKISGMHDDARQGQPGSPLGSAAQGGLLSQIGQMFRSNSGGATLSGGLGELVTRLTSAGQGHAAGSWVSSGSNLPVNGSDLQAALGDETLTEIEQKTGLSRAELLNRLTTSLPDVVNSLTPEGRLLSVSEVQALV